MDPSIPQPTTTASDSPPSYSLPPLPNAKLRLMCSYSGHIAPRPHDKSLCYLGGDTRIVALDRRATAASLSALAAHLSRTLYNNRPFTLKYQLPNEDLDSLISVTTDEDLLNMIEEHDRIVSSHALSRIRLFLFPSKPELAESVLLDPKSESWFCDALKSARIMQRGQLDDSGMGNGFTGPGDTYGEAQFERLGCGGEVNKQESMVLETSSSFGSTGSSASMSNLPPIGVHCEDGPLNLQDKKVKLASPGSIESNNGVNDHHRKTGISQDQFVQHSSFETKLTSNTDDSESIIFFDPSSMIQMHKPLQLSAYQLPHLPEQNPHQREVQYIQAGPHYLPQYPTSPMPISSYYPMYHPQLHPHQHNPHQPYPIYLLPVGPTQSYSIPVPRNINETATVAPVQPPLPPHTAVITPQVAYKDATSAVDPIDNLPCNQNPLMADASYVNEFDDDLACAQIYKSQPPAPALPPQYQTVTMAAGVVLSEP